MALFEACCAPGCHERVTWSIIFEELRLICWTGQIWCRARTTRSSNVVTPESAYARKNAATPTRTAKMVLMSSTAVRSSCSLLHNSQGSVGPVLRWGGKYYMDFVGNLIFFPLVQNYLNLRWRYHWLCNVLFLCTTAFKDCTLGLGVNEISYARASIARISYGNSVLVSVCLSQSGTDRSPGEIETSGFWLLNCWRSSTAWPRRRIIDVITLAASARTYHI